MHSIEHNSLIPCRTFFRLIKMTFPVIISVLGCSSSRVYKNEIELEPGRCRRTDGKRWRCNKDVIPDQKYCARHMHRGARKHVEVSQPVAIPTIGDCPPTRLTIANKAACAAVSTNLSISIPSPQLITQDEKSMSSSSETTISDTTITFFENGNFSWCDLIWKVKLLWVQMQLLCQLMLWLRCFFIKTGENMRCHSAVSYTKDVGGKWWSLKLHA